MAAYCRTGDDRGAVYVVGPVASSRSSDAFPVAGVNASLAPSVAANASWTRLLGPPERSITDADQTEGARFGHAVAVHAATGLVAVSAPRAYTRFGPATGQVQLLRTWLTPEVLSAGFSPAEARLYSPEKRGESFQDW